MTTPPPAPDSSTGASATEAADTTQGIWDEMTDNWMGMFPKMFENPFMASAGSTIPGVKEWTEWVERASIMPKVFEIATRAKKGATDYDVVFKDGPVTLRRYRDPDGSDREFATPLLMVFALVNRPYVLDLLPHKSVIRQFLRSGFDVYLVDWGIPSPGEHSKTLHDYIEGHLQRIVEFVCRTTGQDQTTLLGYCMGGTMASMYTSLHQDLVRNLILMAAPIDWSDKSSLLMTWSNPDYFDVDRIVDTLGNIPADFLGSSFNMLKPVDNYIRKWMGFYERMPDEGFLEEFFAMETWVTDNIPISGEVYRDIVKYGFQQNRLVNADFPLGAHRIDLGEITGPVLNLVADRDHLVPCGQSLPLDQCVSSEDYQVMSVKAGHIGLAVGSRAHRELWPAVCAWLAERSVRA